MKKDLLICIAYKHDSSRLKYIYELLNLFKDEYKIDFDIIVDTDADLCTPNFGFNNVGSFVNKNLEHPFHLTWQHRKRFKDNIDKYENFMYVEDDTLLPFENYLNYLENFKLLWPSFVPSFVRIEENEGEQFITDATEIQPLDVINIYGKEFTSLNNPYHGFWIMPAKELKETMIDNFVRVHQSREHAASYPMWELNKIPLVQIKNKLISKKCYAYHLPNNYATNPESEYGKIKPENLFI